MDITAIPGKAHKFATITLKGKIANVCDAPTDEHILLPNQIALTDKEHRLLYYNDLEEVKALIKSIEHKIKEAMV